MGRDREGEEWGRIGKERVGRDRKGRSGEG